LLGIHHMVWGFHLGIVFAPNHKGMLVVEDGMELDFVRKQVLTSRNVRANVVTDMLYGGLNYQIEHHLFPTMPQWNYRKARKIVRAFCEEKGISYHETCFFGSLVEIVQHLKSVAQVARYTKM
ncbi:delta fatty acid desaturase, partial [Candidatus Peregrinibacteria bacterium CG10_big_fil_rev_8_21_14_0_10_49_16]